LLPLRRFLLFYDPLPRVPSATFCKSHPQRLSTLSLCTLWSFWTEYYWLVDFRILDSHKIFYCPNFLLQHSSICSNIAPSITAMCTVSQSRSLNPHCTDISPSWLASMLISLFVFRSWM
jgi:hypothetical protein